MLVEYNYEDLKEGWDDNTKECCKETPEGGDCNDCCYDKWHNEKKEIDQAYLGASEAAASSRKRLDFLIVRRNKYKQWRDELDKTRVSAGDICGQLEVIAAQSHKIWYSSCKAVDAVEVLFCMVRDFYQQLDYLRKRLNDIDKCISDNTNPGVNRGEGILKYYGEYAKKLETVLNARAELVKQMVNAVRLANLIRNGISSEECKENPCPPPPDNQGGYGQQQQPGPDPCEPGVVLCNNPYYGFRTVMTEWHCSFGCEKVLLPEDCCPPVNCDEPTPTDNQGGYGQQQQQGYGKRGGDCDEPAPPAECKPCVLEPVFTFPIQCDKYTLCIKKKYDDDDACISKLTGIYNEQVKYKESLLACKNSIDAALKEVDPKEKCK